MAFGNNQKRIINRGMSEDQQIFEKWDELLQPNVHVSSQQVPQKHPENELDQEKVLTLENLNSLALFPRMSIEGAMPLNKSMLSKDDELMRVEVSDDDREGSRSQSFQNLQQQNLKQPPVIQEENWFEGEVDLGLSSLGTVRPLKSLGDNTKNVLRNLGCAQNQYALYNKEALQIIQSELSHPEKFYSWVRKLKLENFDGFKAAWAQQTSKQVRVFQRVYKKICWLFYVESAVPYVLASRMKSPKTKISHLKYIYRFLQGIQNPEDFSYFKKVEK